MVGVCTPGVILRDCSCQERKGEKGRPAAEEQENVQDYQKRRPKEEIKNWKQKDLGEFVRQTSM